MRKLTKVIHWGILGLGFMYSDSQAMMNEIDSYDDGLRQNIESIFENKDDDLEMQSNKRLLEEDSVLKDNKAYNKGDEEDYVNGDFECLNLKLKFHIKNPYIIYTIIISGCVIGGFVTLHLFGAI